MDKRKCQKNLPALSGCQFCRCPQPSKRSLGERRGGPAPGCWSPRLLLQGLGLPLKV